MSERPEKISDENVLSVDVSAIAQDRRFDELTFDNAKKKLPKIQKWLIEARDLGAQDLLIEADRNLVSSLTKDLIQHLDNLLTFEIRTTNTTALSEHDALESRIDSFYNSVYQQLPMRILPFLRQEASLNSKDEKALADEQKAATQARKQAEDILDQLNKDLNEFSERKKQLENTAGEVGAKALAIYFKKETDGYQDKADVWFNAALGLYALFTSIVIGVAYYYSFNKEGGWSSLTWQEGVGKLAIFALLWYSLSFVVKNYNVNSHLAAINRHRAAVAGTLEDFLVSGPSATGEMLQNGTDAMFKHSPIGFITKAEKENGNPLLEIVNKIISPKE
ncbi:MAG TPA: hypothetical protein PKD95_02145 [Candidatus Paceibacterota bacterium]|nr:hypothetical protein [Candidatus Paceibacterota bacterium]